MSSAKVTPKSGKSDLLNILTEKQCKWNLMINILNQAILVPILVLINYYY